MPEAKSCSKCGEVKPLDEFYRASSSPDGRQRWCSACARAATHRRYTANREQLLVSNRRYWAENRERLLERDKGRLRRIREELKAAVFAHYGETCACCGTTDQLSIDHVNGDGKQHRIELFGSDAPGLRRMYRWLVRSGFPSGFQTLCVPCNASKKSGTHCRLRHTLNGSAPE